jgi:hypothetical protein
MSISIVSGKEYALLAGDYNYSNLSDSVSFPIGNMPVIELDYFNPNLTSNTIYVTFQAYVNGNSKQYTVTIPPAQFSLYTYQYDDVVYHNATTSTYINFREESNTSAPSGSLTLSASIIRGSKYGVLVNPMTGDKGASLENIATSGGSLILNFEATGENPSIADTVIMHLVPSSASIAPVDIQWVIAPSPIDVTLVPDVLSPGDTANVVIKRKNIDGSTEDFPSDQEFEVSITGGCDGGELLVGDSLANYFSGVTQPVKFVASQSFTSDSIALQIRVGSNIGGGIASSIVKGKNKNAKAVSSALNKKKENYEKLLAAKIQARQKAKTADAGSCYAGEYRTNIFGTCEGGLTNNSPNILLGETKYYQARVNAGGKLQIEEVKPGSDGIPHLNGGITTDVWGSNPVTPVKSGENIGVYWEKEKPVWGTTQNLAKGLIRLIGRYWNKDNTNKIKLTAQSEAAPISIEIEVKKPSKLGSSNSTAKDVFGNLISIDDICITAGEENGIPPQIIKGQMLKETGFTNAYRYEPFVDIKYQIDGKSRKELFENYSYFRVNSINLGSINMPASNIHINVWPNYYPNMPRKIANYITENIWMYIQKPTGKNKYRPVVVGNRSLTDILRNYYVKALEHNKTTAYNNSVSQLKDYLMSDDFPNGKLYAQTRIVASYGMLQQTFYDAHSKNIAGFSVSNPNQPPELLNEMNYSIKAYIKRIGIVINNNGGYNWSKGFENGWEEILSNYNPFESNYVIDVINNSKLFLPIQ